MSDPFLGEIRIMATDFPPRGWAACNGQLMPISQNTALFSLLGVNYGGDGRTSFGLPNLQGRMPMQAGVGPGLSAHALGETGGRASVILQQSEMPAHSHQLMHSGASASTAAPGPSTGFGRTTTAQIYAAGSTVPATPQSLAPNGGSMPHNNLQPYLTLTFCIALQGIWPSRP